MLTFNYNFLVSKLSSLVINYFIIANLKIKLKSSLEYCQNFNITHSAVLDAKMSKIYIQFKFKLENTSHREKNSTTPFKFKWGSFLIQIFTRDTFDEKHCTCVSSKSHPIKSSGKQFNFYAYATLVIHWENSLVRWSI